MASEYLKWRARDVKPEEKRELTPKERRQNWWYYHKWHVLIGLVVLGIVCDICCSALGLGKVIPDCQIAYIGANALPDDTVTALESSLSVLCGDLNGDGKSNVKLVQYTTSEDAAQSSEVLLMSDLLNCESYLFLLEDPEQFQRSYHSLSRLDGSLPDQDDYTTKDVCLAWKQCPVLTGLDLGEYAYRVLGQTREGSSQELVSELYMARRGFWTDKTVSNAEGCAALWKTLTEGANS